MRIAILHDDFPPFHEGGSGVIAAQLAREYSQQGHTVLVVTTVQRREDAGRVFVDGIDVERLYAHYPGRWRAYMSLYNPQVLPALDRVLREFSPEVAHVHNVHLYLSYYSIVVARRYARKVYMTAHDAMSFHYQKLPSVAEERHAGFLGAEPYRESFWRQLRTHRLRYNPLRTPLIRHLLNTNLEGVVAVSEALARALRGNGISQVSVIHNGIEASAWQMPSTALHDREAWGVGDCAILFGGRLSELKGAYQMLEALALVRKTVPAAQLLVIGRRDEQGEKMLARARALGIEQSVLFTGWISGRELRNAYYAASVVAVPSLYLDPFPTVNLEAFVCHKPVVATCYGGSPEIVRDGASGYVVDPFDVARMAERLTELLIDKKKNAAFGERGYAEIVEHFTLAQQAAAYLELFTRSH